MSQSGVQQFFEVPTLERLSELALGWTGPELFEKQPKLVFLRGPMGSGKTSFVAKVADVLGAPEAASPSYSLHSRYEGVRGTIDHLDLDRLETADDLESTGFWDILAEAKLGNSESAGQTARRFVMIEWPKRLEEFGAGAEGSAWTKGFRVWTFEFEGPPNWRVLRRRVP